MSPRVTRSAGSTPATVALRTVRAAAHGKYARRHAEIEPVRERCLSCDPLPRNPLDDPIDRDQARRAGHDRQDQRLGKDLRHDPCPSCPERRPHRQLTEASRRACEDEHRHVRARYQKEGPTQQSQELILRQRVEPRAREPDVGVRERNDLEPPRRRGSHGGMRRRQGQRSDFGLRLGVRRTGRQSAHDSDAAPLPRGRRRIAAHRQPELIVEGKAEILGHDAHHRVGDGSDPDDLADDLRVPGEASLPQPVTDHRHVGRTGCFVRRNEGASELWRNAEHDQRGGGHFRSGHG